MVLESYIIYSHGLDQTPQHSASPESNAMKRLKSLSNKDMIAHFIRKILGNFYTWKCAGYSGNVQKNTNHAGILLLRPSPQSALWGFCLSVDTFLEKGVMK